MQGLVDTHCHLDVSPLGEQVEAVLARARAAGVATILVPAYDLASWDAVAALRRHAGVHVALGLHPWVAAEPLEPGRLAERLRGERAVAVGEIGLDSKVEAPLPRQLEVLRAQLDTAVTLDLPVMLHCRGAFEDLLAVVEDYRPRLRGVLHAFSRGPELARRFLDAGLDLAFGGALTRANASRVRRAAKVVPLDRLHLETDAPSIALEGIEPAQVEPRHVAAVATHLAAVLGISVEEVALRTTENARRLFRV